MEEPEWCNLDSHNVIEKTVLSTKKKIILLKSWKTWSDAKILCESICGAMYFPSTLIENNEVYTIMKKNNFGWIWIRISDEEKEGSWKDPDGKEVLTFTNWESDQPNNLHGNQHWGEMNVSRDGKWNDDSSSGMTSSIICELK